MVRLKKDAKKSVTVHSQCLKSDFAVCYWVDALGYVDRLRLSALRDFVHFCNCMGHSPKFDQVLSYFRHKI